MPVVGIFELEVKLLTKPVFGLDDSLRGRVDQHSPRRNRNKAVGKGIVGEGVCRICGNWCGVRFFRGQAGGACEGGRSFFRWNAAGETVTELVKGDGAHDEPASSNQRNEPFPLDAPGSIGLGRNNSKTRSKVSPLVLST